MADLDWGQLLQDRPDVMTEYTEESTRDRKSQNNLLNMGVLNAEDFAQWWYNMYGRNEGYTQAPKDTGPPTLPPGDPTQKPPPSTGAPDLSGLISGLVGGFQNQVQKEQDYTKMREDARNSVYGALGLTSSEKIGSDLLSQSIADILGTERADALKVLDRGKERGMYTDAGYAKGLAALDANAQKATERLNSAGAGVLDTYRLQLDNVRNNALGVANTITGGTPFNLDPFTAQMNEILGRAQSSAPGALRAALGSDPLFDLGDIRGDIAEEQGALNMRDMDLAEALAKRKKVDSLGRGLGSQGTF